MLLTEVHLNRCLKRPKHQSGLNFVGPTTKKEYVMFTCRPVSTLHIKYSAAFHSFSIQTRHQLTHQSQIQLRARELCTRGPYIHDVLFGKSRGAWLGFPLQQSHVVFMKLATVVSSSNCRVSKLRSTSLCGSDRCHCFPHTFINIYEASLLLLPLLLHNHLLHL